MKKMFLLCLLAPALWASGQKKVNPTKFANSISPADLSARLHIVASREMEGRGTPSPGQEKAASYIESQFRSFGLLPGNNGSFRLRYPIYKDSMTGSTLAVNGTAFQLYGDFAPVANFNYTADLQFSEVVFAGYGIVDGANDDYKDLNVTGKLVLILDGAPADFKSNLRGYRSPAGLYAKVLNAQKKGAAAILILSQEIPHPEGPDQAPYRLSTYSRAITPEVFTVSAAVAEKIMGEDGRDLLSRMKTAPLHPKSYMANVDLSYAKTSIEASACDVLGVLEGTDLKDQYVFVTAHYDHLGKRDTVIYYGADDDGSGTVSVLEIAEAFTKAKAAGHGPRRTMVFMTVSGEEKGLWGSQYYTNHPVFPLDKTTVDLNIDMIGRTDSSRKVGDSLNYVYVVGDDKLSSDLKVISEAVNKQYTRLELDYKFNDPKDPNRIYFRSDHYNFASKGVPIIFYYDGMLGADYHKPTDTPDKINYSLMAKRAKLVFYTAWEMANRDDMLKRDIPLEAPR
ncbi:MAG TPA: M28 family peptidase [Chitinophagaceae bacterium]|nr:M28 family peptidase [Chitinophagaceae bacterium]